MERKIISYHVTNDNNQKLQIQMHEKLTQCEKDKSHLMETLAEVEKYFAA